MERMKQGSFLFHLLLLHFLQIYSATGDSCPGLPIKNLTCYNDFIHTITCVWNSSSVYDQTHDDVCTLDTEMEGYKSSYKASCDLKPFDVSIPALRRCSLVFRSLYVFYTYSKLSINVGCNSSKHYEDISYKPSCHIKLNPPGKPNVNQTTVTWVAQTQDHYYIKRFNSQLQWKQINMLWNDSSVKTKDIKCELPCEAKLDPSFLIKDETYEARVRVEVSDPVFNGTWSNWSPTVSWVSQVGMENPTPEWDMAQGAFTLVALGLLLTGIVIFIHKKKLIYVVKSFKGEPLPDPRKSDIFQNWFNLNSKSQGVSFTSSSENPAAQTWLCSHFTGEYIQSFLSSVEIVSHEVTSTVDAMMFCKADVKMMPESNTFDSSGSSFSNPSYSKLYPCVPNENPKSCAGDGPYKPVQGQCDDKKTEQDNEFLAKKGLEMVKLLFMGAHDREAVVVSDYEKVGKQQAERLRLHSVDSGMCSCEEVSQESMEADSINMTEGPDEGTTHMEEKEEEGRVGNKTKLDFKTLFGGSGSILAKNSICSDYKQIPKLWSEVSMIAEENERQKDSTEKDDKPSEITCFLLPTPLFSALPQQALNIDGSTLSSFLPPLHGNDILKQMALSGSALKQSCADGYMPVGRKRADD